MDKLELSKIVLEGLTELLNHHQDDPVKTSRINEAIEEIRQEADLLKVTPKEEKE